MKARVVVTAANVPRGIATRNITGEVMRVASLAMRASKLDQEIKFEPSCY